MDYCFLAVTSLLLACYGYSCPYSVFAIKVYGFFNLSVCHVLGYDVESIKNYKNLLIRSNLALSVSAGQLIVCVRLPSPLSVGVTVAPLPSGIDRFGNITWEV